MFHITRDNYDGNPPSEVNLGDLLNGKKDWIKYLELKYPEIDAVIYTIAPEKISGAKEIKMENAIQAAKHLKHKVFLCYSWVNYFYPQTIPMQKNDQGEISHHKPAIQDKNNLERIEKFVYDTVKKYQPDGIFLDHFRYEHRNWGYSDLFIQAFEKEYPCPEAPSWTFNLLVSHTIPGRGDYFDEWTVFREKELGQLIKKIVDASQKASIENHNDNLDVAIFVFTPKEFHIRETIHGIGQLNKRNLEKAGIDILAPMSYSIDPKLSFYQTASIRPLGFKLWGAISADDTRFPQDSTAFKEAIQRQFEICDHVIVYEDMFIDNDEAAIIKEFNQKDESLIQTELIPQVLFLYSKSDIINLEGQWWWTAYYSVVEDLIKNNYILDFKMLHDVIIDLENGIFDLDNLPVIIFVRPYEFSQDEEQQISKLKNMGFNFIVINPNRFFSESFQSVKVLESKMVQVVNLNKNSLGNFIANKIGNEIKIAEKSNFIEAYLDVDNKWNVDLTVDGFPVMISKEYSYRKEILTGLTPKTRDLVTEDYGKLFSAMIEWISN